MDQKADEIKRLQGCLNDLISVLALPALWGDHEPSQIVSTLLDVLLGMLRLDFAYARLSEALDGSPIEVVRVAQPPSGWATTGGWSSAQPLADRRPTRHTFRSAKSGRRRGGHDRALPAGAAGGSRSRSSWLSAGRLPDSD